MLIVLEEASYAHRGCIYLIESIVETIIVYATQETFVCHLLSMLKTVVLLNIFVELFFFNTLIQRKFKRK